MKSIDLIRRLDEEGCVFVRHGSRHDWYRNIITGRSEAVPRVRVAREPHPHVLRDPRLRTSFANGNRSSMARHP